MRCERPIADTVLSDDKRVEGVCVSCRAVPLADVVIELQEGDQFGPTRHGITRGTTIYFFDPVGNGNEVFAGLGYRVHSDFPTINWTVDQLAKGIFYHARALNDAFTSVFT